MRSQGERARAESAGVNCLLSLLLLSGKELRVWQCAAFLRVDGRIVGMRFPTEDPTVGVLPRSSHEACGKCNFRSPQFGIKLSSEARSFAAFVRVDGRTVGMRFHAEDSDVGVLPRSSHEALRTCKFSTYLFFCQFCINLSGQKFRDWRICSR